MDEGKILEFAEALKTAEKPYLVLAGLFNELYGRRLERREFGLLRKYIKLYGHWIVYHSLIKTAEIGENFGTIDALWAYIRGVAMSLSNAEIERKSERKFKDQQSERTLQFLQTLKEIKPEPVTLVTKEDL